MKRIVALLLGMSLALSTLSGCYGKFAMTRKVYGVNGDVKDKFLRSAVTWAFVIVPVYGVSALVDFVLFNTIEFWSGSNPIASAEKEFFYTENEERFQIKATKAAGIVSYDITHFNAGKKVDAMNIIWDLKTGNSTTTLRELGRTTEFVASRDKGTVTVQEQTAGNIGPRQTHLASYR